MVSNEEEDEADELVDCVRQGPVERGRGAYLWDDREICEPRLAIVEGVMLRFTAWIAARASMLAKLRANDILAGCRCSDAGTE